MSWSGQYSYSHTAYFVSLFPTICRTISCTTYWGWTTGPEISGPFGVGASIDAAFPESVVGLFLKRGGGAAQSILIVVSVSFYRTGRVLSWTITTS